MKRRCVHLAPHDVTATMSRNVLPMAAAGLMMKAARAVAWVEAVVRQHALRARLVAEAILSNVAIAVVATGCIRKHVRADAMPTNA